jgi:ParB/RepB/Spo0J family partition protein
MKRGRHPRPQAATAAPVKRDGRLNATLIPLSQIALSKTNPRRLINDERLKELAASIKANGVLQPILVRPVGNKFELVAGERRVRAATMAGQVEIPAVIREGSVAEILEWQIVENDQREDVNPMERAYSYLRLKDELGYDVVEIARRVGHSDVTIYQFLSLCKLPDNAKKAIEEGRLSTAVAFRIARLSTEEMMFEAAEDLASPEWSTDRITDAAAAKHIAEKFGERAQRRPLGKRSTLGKRAAMGDKAATDFTDNWKSYLVRFSAEQFLRWKQIVRGRVDNTTLAEAVQVVMIEQREQQQAKAS